MANNRIKRTPPELKLQLEQAAAAATALGPGWPASAPTPAQLTAAANDLGASITQLAAIRADLSQGSDLKDTRMGTGWGYMERVDEATDFLLGPESPGKLDYGLPPRGSGTVEALHQLIQIELRDGPVPGSLFFDFENIQGCSYEVQWSTTSNFATITGSATASGASEYVIGGLTPGTQYWVRVRPHRGSQTAAWSDPATRVAPV